MGSNISTGQKSSSGMNSRNIEGQQTSSCNNTPAQKPIRGILKNKHDFPEIQTKAVKMVELYIQIGNEWKVEKLREDEVEKRRKELKCDKAVNRTYLKPVHDDRYLHFKY